MGTYWWTNSQICQKNYHRKQLRTLSCFEQYKSTHTLKGERITGPIAKLTGRIILKT